MSEENEAARRERLAEIQEHLRVLINSDLIIGSEKGELLCGLRYRFQRSEVTAPLVSHSVGDTLISQ